MTLNVEQRRLADPLPKLRGHLSYVLEPLKIVYISVPKNACTSLTWLMAELAGEDLDSFRPGLRPRVNNDDAIHVRARFRHVASLAGTSPDVRATISPDTGWFVFAVVRDPRARVFSAWQNKLLLRTPDFSRWRDADWYPQLPTSAEGVARDFARFIEFLAAEPDHPVARDGHFCDQTQLVRPDAIPYSRLYDVSELPTLLADLGAHLRAQGVARKLTLRTANETPLRPTARVFAEPVRTQIEQLYAVDFETFDWDFARIRLVPDWPADTLADLLPIIGLHERIDELLHIAIAEQKRRERAEERLAEARRLAQAVPPSLRARLAARLTARLPGRAAGPTDRPV